MIIANHRQDQREYRITFDAIFTNNVAHAALSGRRPIDAVRMCSSSGPPGRVSFFALAPRPVGGQGCWRAICRRASGRGSGSNRYRFATGVATNKSLKSRDNPAGSSGSRISSRVTRAGRRVQTRAYARTEILLPCYQLNIHQWIEWVSGSKSGSKPVADVTDRPSNRAKASASPGLSNVFNKIAGGYWGTGAGRAAQGLFAGGGRRNFRGRIRAAGGPAAEGSAWSGSCSSSAGGNGGFPGFPGGASGSFGMACSEWSNESEYYQSRRDGQHKLSRLACGGPGRRARPGGPPGSIGPIGPPGPPNAPRDPSTTLARDAIGILIEALPMAVRYRPIFGRGGFRGPMGSGVRGAPAGSELRRKIFPENGARQLGQGHGMSVETGRVGAGAPTLWGGRGHVN